MGNRTIPILISSMVLALLGIIFIQYKWIEESIDEKKKLVDHKVHQVAANVDQQMTDHNALAYVSSVPQLDSALIAKMTAPFDMVNYDTTYVGDSMLVSYVQEFVDTNSRSEVEVRIISDEHFSNHPTNPQHDPNHVLIQHSQVDCTNAIFSPLNGQQDYPMQFDELSSMFERIQIEVGSSWEESRFDSSLFSKKLINESEAFGLISPSNWAVYDNLNKTYTILPVKEETWDFEIPIFNHDIIYPDRYTLMLNMADNNDAIWKQIALMISLSLLFIAIIIFVFIYSIRLVIKHKKISAIKSDFINNMTHEFKTPLASISLAADSILHPKVDFDPAKVKGYIDIIKAEKTKLNRHIETILEVASLKQNNVEIKLSELIVSEYINNAIDKLGLLIEDKNCNVNLDLDETIKIKANPYQLENVFSNLIENSIKYSKDSPAIQITSLKKGNTAVIRIVDKGIGMTKEQVKKAFDNFYRAQKGNIHDTKGFGLGLSFVKYMVGKMNGAIRIESELSHGTTVIIEFPLCH